MAGRNTSLINQLASKNIKDTVILGIVTILISAFILYIKDKTLMISCTAAILLIYFIQYQLSRNELIRSIDKLIDTELREFQKISVKVLQLSEKQRQLTNKYTDRLNQAFSASKTLKNGTIKTKDKTQSISAKIKDTYDYSNREIKFLNDNISSMQSLKHKVQAIAELVIELTDYIKQIGAAVSIVENISEQTNMLALNAAVEAARAGEYGKGFAVVAGEIRKLADESKQATNKITALASELEQTSSSAFLETEDGTKEIENGVRLSSELNAGISDIFSRIKELSTDLNDVLASSIEQQSAANDVIDIIENMQKSISETLNTLEENIDNIRAFSEISVNIKDNIAN